MSYKQSEYRIICLPVPGKVVESEGKLYVSVVSPE